MELLETLVPRVWVEIFNATPRSDWGAVRAKFQSIYKRPLVTPDIAELLELQSTDKKAFEKKTKRMKKGERVEMQKQLDEAKLILQKKVYRTEGVNTTGVRQIYHLVEIGGPNILKFLRGLEPRASYNRSLVEKLRALQDLPKQDCYLCGYKDLAQQNVTLAYQENGEWTAKSFVAGPGCATSIFRGWDVEHFENKIRSIQKKVAEGKEYFDSFKVIESIDDLKSVVRAGAELDDETKERLTEEYRQKLLERLSLLEAALGKNPSVEYILRDLGRGGLLGALEPFAEGRMSALVASVYEKAVKQEPLHKIERAVLADFYLDNVPRSTATIADVLIDLDALEKEKPFLGKNKELVSLPELTGYQMFSLTQLVDLDSIRRERDDAFARKYNTTVHEVITALWTAYDAHKKDSPFLHHEDLRLIETYRQLWMVGKTAVEKDAEKIIDKVVQTIYNTRSFVGFESDCRDLVTVKRKLESGSYESLIEPCLLAEDTGITVTAIEGITNCLTTDSHYNSWVSKSANGVKNLVANGLVPSGLLPQLARFSEIAAQCYEPGGRESERLKIAKELVGKGIVKSVEGLQALELVKTASKVSKAAMKKVEAMAKTRQGVDWEKLLPLYQQLIKQPGNYWGGGAGKDMNRKRIDENSLSSKKYGVTFIDAAKVSKLAACREYALVPQGDSLRRKVDELLQDKERFEKAEIYSLYNIEELKKDLGQGEVYVAPGFRAHIDELCEKRQTLEALIAERAKEDEILKKKSALAKSANANLEKLITALKQELTPEMYGLVKGLVEEIGCQRTMDYGPRDAKQAPYARAHLYKILDGAKQVLSGRKKNYELGEKAREALNADIGNIPNIEKRMRNKKDVSKELLDLLKNSSVNYYVEDKTAQRFYSIWILHHTNLYPAKEKYVVHVQHGEIDSLGKIISSKTARPKYDGPSAEQAVNAFLATAAERFRQGVNYHQAKMPEYRKIASGFEALVNQKIETLLK